MTKARLITDAALEAGFDLAGCAPAEPARHGAAFAAWLARGDQAGMDWMAATSGDRLDPRRRWPDARTLLVVGLSYHVGEPPADFAADPARGRVARYAWGADYHDVMRARLRGLAERLRREYGETTPAASFIDTAPVLERGAAARAGLGFVGRNTSLISPAFGSFVFLGGLVLPFDVGADWTEEAAPGEECGACRRCLDACPTGALAAEYRVDSRRCISWLTIENRGPVPDDLCPRMGRWIFGCDECQLVCPWVRKFSRAGRAEFLRFEPELHAPRLEDVLALDEAEFRRRYRGTPIWRAKRSGFVRNAVIALANSGLPDTAARLERAARDSDPLVRSQAELARNRLTGDQGPTSTLNIQH